MKIGIHVSEWKTHVFSKSEWFRKSLWPFYRIRKLEPVSCNSWNAIFRADSVSGALCIKVLNECTTGISHTEDELAYINSVMNTFAKVDGLMVPCPVQGTDGQSTHRIGKYWCIAYPWIEMKNFIRLVEDAPQTQAVAVPAAYMLARIHECGRRCRIWLSERPCTQLYPAFSVQMWYEHLDEIWRKSEEHMRFRGLSRQGRAFLKEAHCACNEFLTRIHILIENHTSHYAVLHGDYRPENIAISMRRVVLWDFDLSHLDIPETEIAYAALSFSGPRFFLGPRKWNNVKAFISAYSEASKIPLSVQLCDTALEWQVVRAMSLSFDEVQLRERLDTYRNLREKLSHLST